MMKKNRCSIWLVDETSKFYEGISCQEPLEQVIPVLKENYKDLSEINHLISLGNLTKLGTFLDPINPEKHTLETPEPFCTVSFSRDGKRPFKNLKASSIDQANQLSANLDLEDKAVFHISDFRWHNGFESTSKVI